MSGARPNVGALVAEIADLKQALADRDAQIASLRARVADDIISLSEAVNAATAAARDREQIAADAERAAAAAQVALEGERGKTALAISQRDAAYAKFDALYGDALDPEGQIRRGHAPYVSTFDGASHTTLAAANHHVDKHAMALLAGAATGVPPPSWAITRLKRHLDALSASATRKP